MKNPKQTVAVIFNFLLVSLEGAQNESLNHRG